MIREAEKTLTLVINQTTLSVLLTNPESPLGLVRNLFVQWAKSVRRVAGVTVEFCQKQNFPLRSEMVFMSPTRIWLVVGELSDEVCIVLEETTGSAVSS